ncbi:MAG: chorismate-binding protein [Verrucomicrobiota bacterium]
MKILQTNRLDNVYELLEEADRANHGGYYIAGYVSYEASNAFDTALKTHPPDHFPLVWLGVFNRPEPVDNPFDYQQIFSMELDWIPSVDDRQYQRAISKIRRRIEAGYTYQVNFSYRLTAENCVHPRALLASMMKRQKTGYAAYIDTNDFAICSASPELFFLRQKDRLISKPMKGTAPRGLTPADDLNQAQMLCTLEKTRAENVMIVDMVRNDMGRIAVPGTVRVPVKYRTEKYPTLWQMTSTVTCRTNASLPAIFRALFPCASITGAPKAETMRLIHDLETLPRRIYTGAIGFADPESNAQFNVAIRTALVDKRTNRAEYGVGGGILWDSIDNAELEECRTKAMVLAKGFPDFKLLETILWTRENGFFLLDYHVKRLAQSAQYFDFAINLHCMRKQLKEAAQSLAKDTCKLRLLLAPDGSLEIQAIEIEPPELNPHPRRARISAAPVDQSDVFLYHKTTNRPVYDSALAANPGFDDVILWNRNNEVTESCIANVVVEKEGKMWTPPVKCGLLAGVYRQWMLDTGRATEAVISLEDLRNSSRIYLVNSVQGLKEAVIL